MKRFLGAVLATILVTGPAGLVRADDSPTAILDKAIKAIGGEEKLKQAESVSSKSKGTFTFNGNESKFTIQVTLQGLDHCRNVFDGEFGGNPVHGVTVLNGNKGWRSFGDNKMDMDEDAVANEKRSIYLQTVHYRLNLLKDKPFKVEAAGEEKVGDKPAVGLKVTGPDGKDFKLYFDKESGLPVKMVAVVAGFGGEEFTQETTYKDYKDFDGIKRATKTESKRNGETFINAELTEFKTLDKVDPKTFAEPE
jgi:hypothetical protein